MSDRLEFILSATQSQERVLFLVAGSVWEGHIESCLGGVVTAVAREVGAERPFARWEWRLEEIADMAAEPDVEGDEG